MATGSETVPSNEKIKEALELLNQAAKQKKVELKELANNKYTDLRQSFADIEQGLEGRIAEVVRRAEAYRDVGEEKMREVAGTLDKKAHDEPWKMMGWIATSSLIIGFLLGRRD